jgi:transcription termination/antitermination protein NusA
MESDAIQVAQLFAQEVREIAEGRIEIKAIARKAGYRCKVALHSQDPRLDYVGVCIGIRGQRIKNIVDALGGERIDLFRWNESPEQLLINALQPAVIERVILYPRERRALVIVKPDQVSLVHGRGDENRRLASELSGWQIDVEEW